MDAYRARKGGPVGSNQEQGKGEIPSKVSVPMPGMNGSQKAAKKHMTCKTPAGFGGGVIPGKI